MSVVELHAVLRSRSFLHLVVVTLSEPVWGQSSVETVDLRVAPFSLYVDDSFVYSLISHMDRLTSLRVLHTSHRSEVIQGLRRVTPGEVEAAAHMLTRPVRIRQLSVQVSE